MQGCETLAPAKSYSAHHPIQQPYNHYHGRRVDFCEGDEGFVCVGSSGKTAKVSAMPSPEKPPLLTPKKDKVPVLLSFLPNETALVTDSEDDSDANETLHDTETMPGEAHASIVKCSGLTDKEKTQSSCRAADECTVYI